MMKPCTNINNNEKTASISMQRMTFLALAAAFLLTPQAFSAESLALKDAVMLPRYFSDQGYPTLVDLAGVPEKKGLI
jgi:hypothetical protein